MINDRVKILSALHYRVGHNPGAPQSRFGSLDRCDRDMSFGGPLAFNRDEHHTYSTRGSNAVAASAEAVDPVVVSGHILFISPEGGLLSQSRTRTA